MTACTSPANVSVAASKLNDCEVAAGIAKCWIIKKGFAFPVWLGRGRAARVVLTQ
jgi:hypothetical protein